MLTLVIANLWSKRRFKLKDFLPPWYEIPMGDPRAGFESLLKLAEVSDADDLNADGRRRVSH